MSIRQTLLTALIICGSVVAYANVDYDNDPVYIMLRDSVHESFNNADEERFPQHIKKLEDYLLKHDDMHGYYTQRCNEIVFMMNAQKVFEAYKAARELSAELRDKKLDKEMYMAYNMLGHIYRYCGNKEAAKRNFLYVIELMEKSDYYNSMPPIYMNIVGVVENDDPKQALQLIDKALAIAKEHAPERVFDIETRRTLIYYNMGNKEKFLKGYEAYKKGVAEGQSSVHGRSLEVYHEAFIGNTDNAAKMAIETLGEDSHSTLASIYREAGRWEEAYKEQAQETKETDSIYSIILSNSMEGLRTELHVYDLERKAARSRTITLTIIIALLLALLAAQIYIYRSRRRHVNEMKIAYQHALESDKMKSAFIQNMSHEVRTPLNIISGFAQVVADPEMTSGPEERREIAQMMLNNTRIITNLIDEMLELSINETAGEVVLEGGVDINDLLSNLLQENEGLMKPEVKLVYDNHLPSNFTMTTNKDMLRRMVNALLDNAIKYTERGSVTLKAYVNTGKLEIIIEDTGIGIPAQEANRIFERFVKLNTFKEGLGLGLPLTRMIASRLRGYLIYDPSYSPGARFVLSIPI